MAKADTQMPFCDTLFKVFMGEETDKGSGLPHLAHVCWNALAILELTVHEK